MAPSAAPRGEGYTGWTLVGGPKRLRGRHQHQAPGAEGHPGAAVDAAAEAAAPAAAPGWGVGADSSAGDPAATSSSARSRRRGHKLLARTDEEVAEAVGAQVRDAQSRLAPSRFFAGALGALSGAGLRAGGVAELVMYGVGSPERSASARAQLAFGVLLASELRVPPERVRFFDPVLSDADAMVLRDVGATPIVEDEEGRRAATSPATLFYMPHCEAWLYDNLVAAHCARAERAVGAPPGGLARVVVLGNSFDRYEERWDHAATKPPGERPDAMLRAPRRETRVLPHEFKGDIAFAEMAVVDLGDGAGSGFAQADTAG